MFTTALCTFSAVPFAMTDNENRPILALPPSLFNSASGDGGIDVESLANALVQRMRGLFSPPPPPEEVLETGDAVPRRQRTRHNAGSGAAEDYPMAPMPDIVVSSNYVVSPTWTIDSGVNSPQDPDVFSFNDDEVANYRDEQPGESGAAVGFLGLENRAWQLAPPPRGRRSVTPEFVDVDEGVGLDAEPEMAPVPSVMNEAEKLADGQQVGNDEDGKTDADISGNAGPRAGNRAENLNGAWKNIGRGLRQIADDYHHERTGEPTVEPWCANFGDFLRVLISFLWTRLIRQWLLL